MNAKEIEKTFEAWFATDPHLPEFNWEGKEMGSFATINTFGDLIDYLEDYAEKDADGNRWVEVPGLTGRVRLLELKGGMDEGTYAHAVLEIEYVNSDPRHFMVDGWYASGDGHHYEGPFHEVKAIKKLVDDWANV